MRRLFPGLIVVHVGVKLALKATESSVDVKIQTVLGVEIAHVTQRRKYLHMGMSQPCSPDIFVSFLLFLGCFRSSCQTLITQTLCVAPSQRLWSHTLTDQLCCCCRASVSSEIREVSSHGYMWGGGGSEPDTTRRAKGGLISKLTEIITGLVVVLAVQVR